MENERLIILYSLHPYPFLHLQYTHVGISDVFSNGFFMCFLLGLATYLQSEGRHKDHCYGCCLHPCGWKGTVFTRKLLCRAEAAPIATEANQFA
jgi:hypothetical protein